MLHVVHDGGVARYQGTAALQTASVLVASSNRLGASDGQVRTAVSHIERLWRRRRVSRVRLRTSVRRAAELCRC